MAVTSKGPTVLPQRVPLPRGAASRVAAVPALVAGGRVGAVRPYVGRSRFVLTPLSLSLDQLLFLITAALLCFGLLMVQSADSRVRGVHDNWFTQSFNNKNAIHAVIALLAMTAMWRFDYRKLMGKPRNRFGLLLSPAMWLVALTVGFLLAVLVTPLGKEINGARRWFGFGPLGFQPSELAKLSLVLFVAAYATHRAAQVRSFFLGFVPLMGVFGVCAALVVKEDFGTTVLVSAVALTMVLMAGCRVWHVGLLMPGAAVVIWHMLNTPFRRARLLAFLDPESDSQGAGFHVIQSLLTIASGAPWGKGLGNGIQKMGYLPEDNTDFIFAVVCEELGLVGAVMVIGLFAAFVVVGWRVMSRCNNLFGKMVAFGITAMIGLQAAINVAVVTASMPTKGIALPLISSGGTGWIMNAVAIGVLMSIERINRLERAAARGTSAAHSGQGFPVQLSEPKSVAAIPVVPATPVVVAKPVQGAGA
jgi:cell division protein FtsW